MKHALFVVGLLLIASNGQAQFTQTGGYYRTTTTGTGLGTPAKGLQIGGAPNTSQGAAFTIRADQTADVNVTLGEAFRSVVRNSDNSFWRMYRRNTGAILTDLLEVGRLSNATNSADFNIDAPRGQLRLGTGVAGTGLTTWLRLMPSTSSVSVNGNTVNNSGFALLGGDVNAVPWTRLHMDAGEGQPADNFRSWMREGLLTTGAERTMYFGLNRDAFICPNFDATSGWLQAGNQFTPDNRRHVIQWGGINSHETLSFVLTTEGSSENYGQYTVQYPDPADPMGTTYVSEPVPGTGSGYGREVARFDRRGLRVGETAFFNSKLSFPTTALTVCGRMAVTDLPDQNAIAPPLLRLLSVNDTGVVGVRPVEPLPLAEHVLVTDGDKVGQRPISSFACDWTWDGNATNPMFTAVDNGLCGPQGFANVGIGTDNPGAKLSVMRKDDNGAAPIKIAIEALNPVNATDKAAIYALSYLSSPLPGSVQRGGVGVARDGQKNYGLMGYGESPNGLADLNVGVYGGAECPNPNGTAYGIWGQSPIGTPDPSCKSWAGWFDGPAYSTGGFNLVADQTKILTQTGVSGAMTLVNQLLPKRVTYNIVANPSLRLPSGQHMTLLAQDMLLVPNLAYLVKTGVKAARPASNGTIGEPVVTVQTVNYTELIPLLVAAIKELDGRLTATQAQVSALASQLNTCCPGGGNFRTVEQMDDGATGIIAVPNPFSTSTTLHYQLAGNSNVRITVLDASGQQVAELFNGSQEAGSHQVEWNAYDAAQGLYHVTVWVNNEAQVGAVLKVGQ